MIIAPGNIAATATTSHRVVLPFYLYAAIAFLLAAVLLLFSGPVFSYHFFHPKILAVTHLMALGWGTMIILGASHQLVPVIAESKLYSNKLAYITFVLAAVGIPLLVVAFYQFNMGTLAQLGGSLVVLSVLSYLLNLYKSITNGNSENVHVAFAFTAAVWLLTTVTVGLVLVFNFTMHLLQRDSVYYLSMHAHLGIVGWFLLLVIGVGSRLIPMFLISKYSNARLLWIIYSLINSGLLSFVFVFLYAENQLVFMLPLSCLLVSVLLFIRYCYRAFQQRIRRQVDEPMKISLLSAAMLVVPVLLLVVVLGILWLTSSSYFNMVIAYGFAVFFGWITAIILGMTFKTLPFIVWNKVYKQRAGKGNTPNPKQLVSDRYFKWMSVAYITGFTLFLLATVLQLHWLLSVGTLLLVAAAALYNLNVFKIIFHQPTQP